MLRGTRFWVAVLALLGLLGSTANATIFDDVASPAWELEAGGTANAIASSGSAVYIGGDFDSINDGAGGSVSQAHLAAFDSATGAHLAAFQPQLNGPVHALATTDDGSRLFVGGGFSHVGGVAVGGLAELDPVTGALLNNLESGTDGTVYGLDIDDGWLYVAGNLNWVGSARVTGAGRINLASGTADGGWAPDLANGSTRTVAGHQASGRVFVGGFFTMANGDPSVAKLAAVSASDGSNDPFFQPGVVEEVFDLAVTDDKLYLAHGGPGGRADVRDVHSGSLLRGHLTDGDVQAVEVSGERVYFGQHGELVDGVHHPWLFALDRATDDIDDTFAPGITATAGSGLWALHEAGGFLWAGGAIESAAPVDGVGFLRFPAAAVQPDDTSAPTAPINVTAGSVGDDFVQLMWDASLDDSGAVYYRVRRDGAIVASASTPTVVDRSVAPGTTYTYAVEAVDAAQNATSSPPIVVTTLPVLTALEAIPLGSEWRYHDSGSVAAGWEQLGFDDASWELGAAELGRSDGDEATVIDHPPAPELTVYFRHEFEVPAGQSVVTATLDYLRDDALLVRINGVEVFRENLPEGPIESTTRALLWQTATEATVFTVPVDSAAITEGTNVLTVELHNVTHGSDLSFNAALHLGLVNDSSPPTEVTGLVATGVAATSVSLAWDPSTDDQGVIGYEILRDGNLVTMVPELSYTDVGLTAETSYTYTARAVDAGQNRSAVLSDLVVTTTAEQIDDIAPTTPTGLAPIVTTNSSIALQWDASFDAVGVIGYQVWRDGVEIDWAPTTSYVDTGLDSSTQYSYTVVAQDAAGNTSDATDPLFVSTSAQPPEDVEILPFGSDWAYLDTGSYPGDNWTLGSYDDASWSSGPAHLGVGDGDEVTVVAQRPTVWFRSEFTIADPAMVVDFGLDIVADDGAVVFVNGVEVVRDNVGPGPVDGSTPALGYRWGASEDLSRSFDVPPGVLTAGTNTLAVAILNGPGSSDMSFDLRAEISVGDGGAPDTSDPTVPTGLSGTATSNSASLTWNAATDNVAVAGYDLFRDNTLIATVTATTYDDAGLGAGTTYNYEVEAFDPAGNRSGRSGPLVLTTLAQPPVESDLMPMGSTWSYLDSGSYPGAAWTDVAYDDAGWAQGVAPFAANDPGTTIVSNRPTLWFRTEVDVASVQDIVSLDLDLRADDALVVFVNGVEALRFNIGAGPVDGSTVASTYRWGAAETEVLSFALDKQLFVDGTNVIAVALVNGNRSGDASFDVGIRQFTQP